MDQIVAILGYVFATLGGAAVAGVPLYLKLRTGIAEARKQERDAIEGEWSRAVSRLDTEVKRQDDEIVALKGDNSKLTALYLESLRNEAKNEALIKILQFQVEQLRRISVSAAISLATTVTADMTGMITDADESVKDILGWRAAELVGKNVDVIIPRDIRGKHHAGFTRAQLSGSVRPETIAINSTALHRSGDRIAVTVSLSGFKGDDGKPLICAQIFHRKVFDVIESGSGDHVPLGAAQPTLPPGGSGISKKSAT